MSAPHVLYVGGEDHELRLSFLLAMRDRGFRVSAAGSGDPASFLRAGIAFYPFHFTRFMSPLADWRSIQALARLLDELRPDVAQGYDTKPCLMLPMAARLASNNTRVIRTICGRAWVYSPGSMLAWSLRPIYRGLHRLASRFTAATVFEIADDKNFFETCHMAGRNGVVIPAGGGGVDVEGVEKALATSPSRDEMRRQLGMESSEIVITVSRMTRQKGILTLLAAAQIVNRARPGVRFLLVGPRESEGPLAIGSQEIEAHKPYVVALGPRSDVPALLRAADVFAFPTEYREGVPRALLEAAFVGLPIVTTSMPGCCAVIKDGWNGRVVPPHAPERLAHQILALLANKRDAAAFAENGADLVRRTFSLGAIADSHDALYSRILGEMGADESLAREASPQLGA